MKIPVRIRTIQSFDFVFRYGTIELRWPLGGTLGLAGLLLVIAFIGLELTARTDRVQAALPLPAMGTFHRQFDYQVARLEKLVDERGPIDCLFIGASGLHHAVEPQLFMSEYEDRTGEKLHCFDFGISGLNARTAAVLSEILVNIYQPKLLIYGLDVAILPRNEDNRETRAMRSIRSSPWVRLHRGMFSINGWLLANSYAYRHILPYADWLTGGDETSFVDRMRESERADEYGFHLTTRTMEEISESPDVETEPRFFEEFAEFEIKETHRRAFRQMNASRGDATLIVVEVPVHESFYQFFPDGYEEYRSVVDEIEIELSDNNVRLISPGPMNWVPDEAWVNRNHLNIIGAQIFTPWLAAQVVESLN